MNKLSLSAAIVSFGVMLAVSGCGRQSEADTQAGVAKAQAEGIKDVASAKEAATDKMADDQRDVTKAQDQAGRDADTASRNISIAKSEAEHKIALERCEGLASSERSLCKKTADGNFDAEKSAQTPGT